MVRLRGSELVQVPFLSEAQSKAVVIRYFFLQQPTPLPPPSHLLTGSATTNVMGECVIAELAQTILHYARKECVDAGEELWTFGDSMYARRMRITGGLIWKVWSHASSTAVVVMDAKNAVDIIVTNLRQQHPITYNARTVVKYADLVVGELIVHTSNDEYWREEATKCVKHTVERMQKPPQIVAHDATPSQIIKRMRT